MLDLETIFMSGEETPISGTYVCQECLKGGEVSKLAVTKGELIPPCLVCEEPVGHWKVEKL